MKFILLTFLAVCTSQIFFTGIAFSSDSNDCMFMDHARRQIESDPYELAESNFQREKDTFFSVGVGFAGIVPGFEGDSYETLKCVENSYDIEMIWVDGDVISCEGQPELGQKVIEWAKKYNIHMKSLIIKANKFKCGM